MSEFTIHTVETAPEGSKEMMEGLKKAMGFVPNMMAAMAESPVTLKSFMAVNQAFNGATLTPVEREIALLTVSDVNDCEYCLAAHSAMAKRAKMPAEVLETLRERRPLADAKLEALREFTHAVTANAGRVTAGQIGKFLAAGYSREQLLEVITAVTLMTLTNYVNHVLETPIDAAFEPTRWPAK